MSRQITVACLLVAAACPAAPRTDADGVPLPEGAVARLGSARYRFAGTGGQLVFSPDGKLLAVASDNGADVLDAATGRLSRHFPEADHQSIQMVRFVADGERLAVGTHGGKNQLAIFDLTNGKPIGTWSLPFKNGANIADMTPDGKRVLYMDWGERVCLWDVTTQKDVWSLALKNVASVLPFTTDGRRFALVGDDKAELYDAQTGKLVGQYPKAGPGYTEQIAITRGSDGRRAVASDRGDHVAVLAAEGADRLRILPADGTITRSFTFSPDGRYLVGAGQVWDLREKDDKARVARLSSAGAAAFSPDGKTLALADSGYVTLWSVGDWKPRPGGPEPASPVRRAWFTPEGKRVIGHTRTGFVSWPAAGGPITRLSDDSPTYLPGGAPALADLSADGRVAADVLNEPGKGADRGKFAIRITNLTTGKDVRIPLKTMTWEPVHVSPDGRHMSSESNDRNLTIWDAATGTVLFEEARDSDRLLLGHVVAADGKGLAVSLRGKQNRTGGRPGMSPTYSAVTVTDHRSGRKFDLDPLPWAIFAGGVRFTPDGTRFALHSEFEGRRFGSSSVSVWDVRTGKRLMDWERSWERSGAYITAFTLAVDGRSVLVGDSKGKLVLIEVATGGERVAFGHHGQVYSAAFAPDGTRILSTSPDAPVYIWDLIGEPGPWDAKAVWADLASADAKTAFAAIRKLRAKPDRAVAFLKDRVKVPAVPTDETVAKWLKGLDAAAFAERERAQKELTAAADLIRPKLEAAHKTVTEEAGRRLDRVLKAADGWTPEKLRHLRACEVLEGIGTPEAMRVLKAMAAGPAGSRAATEAAESLARRR